MLTSSLGCTLVPRSATHRCAITSLAFMLRRGARAGLEHVDRELRRRTRPRQRAGAAWDRAWPGSSTGPRSALACAAAALISPSARMNSRGMVSPEIGKLSTARWVCAPYSASAGTFSSPMLSCSMRYLLIRRVHPGLRCGTAIIVADWAAIPVPRRIFDGRFQWHTRPVTARRARYHGPHRPPRPAMPLSA